MKKIRMTLFALLCVVTLGSCSKSDTDATPEKLSKTLNLSTSGTLSSFLPYVQRSSITSLKITGAIDARDFKTMRDSLPFLANIDLSNATIYSYSGNNGTKDQSLTYDANSVPVEAFYGSQANAINVDELPGTSTSTTPAGKMSLVSVIFPSNLKEIGLAAFYDCTSMTGNLVIPESVTKIGMSAFEGCVGLTQLTLPSTLDTIDEKAFSDCSKLSGELKIPASVKFIGAYAFKRCSGFTGSLVLPATIEEIDYAAFAWCSGFTGELGIPSSLEVINTATFYACSGLTAVIIPASVTSISQEAFSCCTNIEYIKSLGAQPATINYNGSLSPFYQINKSTCVLNVPAGTKDSYAAANQWKDFLNIVDTYEGQN